MYLELPIRSDLPAYEFQMSLENILYGFEFRWNSRGEFWTMDIKNSSGVSLLVGIKIITLYPLLLGKRNDGLPPGEFICFDTANKNEDPGVDNFGSRFLLLYRESTTVDA